MENKICFKIVSVFSLLLILLLNISCKKSLNGPVENTMLPDENVIPGSRNYTWTIDTIKTDISDVLVVTNIWGSSPNDIWAVGFADMSSIEIWHYDGKTWQTDSVHRKLASIYAIYGFSSNDIWIGDSEGNMWHYTNSWQQITCIHPIQYSYGFTIVSIWGNSPNSLYATGYEQNGVTYTRASIWKYNGLTWDSLQVPELPLAFDYIQVHSVTGDIYLTGYSYSEAKGLINYAYVKDKDSYKKLDETTDILSLVSVGDKLFYNIGRKLYYYQGGKLQLWKDFSAFFPYNHFFARSSKDIFSASPDGILHYNGSDVALLFRGNYKFGNAAIFDKDIFIIANDNIRPNASGANLIIHGKLIDDK